MKRQLCVGGLELSMLILADWRQVRLEGRNGSRFWKEEEEKRKSCRHQSRRRWFIYSWDTRVCWRKKIRMLICFDTFQIDFFRLRIERTHKHVYLLPAEETRSVGRSADVLRPIAFPRNVSFRLGRKAVSQHQDAASTTTSPFLFSFVLPLCLLFFTIIIQRDFQKSGAKPRQNSFLSSNGNRRGLIPSYFPLRLHL